MRIFIVIILISISLISSYSQESIFIDKKVKGLLLGSFIGDALGGPIEFQGHPEIQATERPPKLWKNNEYINDIEIQKAIDRIYLREYRHLRPVPEPYGHWGYHAAPGTVTDDSRHKMVLMQALREANQKNIFPITEKTLAKTYLNWAKSKTVLSHPGYDTLCQQWMYESYLAINWLLGNRTPGKAYPIERMWNALPTCYGQMTLPPVAALYPGEPEKAYLAAYQLAYFDNGFAKDMIGALVAGLSKALVLDPNKLSNEQSWQEIIKAIRNTDPYNYKTVPWSERAVDRWLNLSDEFVKQSNGSPAKLFELLEKEFLYTTKWEAQVPFVIMFSVLKITNYNPLAALQLSIEWGWDHDSYAQLLGAFIGALHGDGLFKEEWKSTVTDRLKKDYDVVVDEWVSTLFNLHKKGKSKQLVAFSKY